MYRFVKLIVLFAVELLRVQHVTEQIMSQNINKIMFCLLKGTRRDVVC